MTAEGDVKARLLDVIFGRGPMGRRAAAARLWDSIFDPDDERSVDLAGWVGAVGAGLDVRPTGWPDANTNNQNTTKGSA